jgi:hypothetical protein
MIAFQLIFAPLFLLLALRSLWLGVRGRRPRRQALLWTALWGLGAALVAQPGISVHAAAVLGIGRGADLVFYLAVVGGLLACSYFYTRYRRLEMILTQLIRKESIVEARRGAGGSEEIEG